jgi:hypothetical protein
VKTIVIFGTQRCGSNFFLSACQELEDLTVFGEMYHRGGAFPFRRNPNVDFAIRQRLGECIRRDFAEQSQDSFGDWTPAPEMSNEANAAINRALVKFSHKSPNRYFEALQQAAHKSRLIFKIFPEHLEMMQILSILREQRPKVLFLLRSPLDSFISYKKLVETCKPQDADTSSVKIRFNAAEYFAYKANVATYFRTIKEYCDHENLDVATCHYEWLHSDAVDNKMERIRDLLQMMYDEPVRLSKDADLSNLFTRQDMSDTPAQKVVNPGALPRGPQISFGG